MERLISVILKVARSMVLGLAFLSASFVTESAQARMVEEVSAGFYWTCDTATGDFVCGYSSPYGYCQYTTGEGVVGYMPTGGRLVGYYGYDCRKTMPDGPFWQ